MTPDLEAQLAEEIENKLINTNRGIGCGNIELPRQYEYESRIAAHAAIAWFDRKETHAASDWIKAAKYVNQLEGNKDLLQRKINTLEEVLDEIDNIDEYDRYDYAMAIHVAVARALGRPIP